MSESEGALQRILAALDAEKPTTKGDWKIIFGELMGNSDAETINNIQDFILEKFSFEIAEGAEGFAYYGMTGSAASTVDTPIYMVLDTLVKENSTEYGYISSTQAGKLLNDRAFKDMLATVVDDDIKELLYNGVDGTGYIEDSVRSFNDFFSENYIRNISQSNLTTVLSGDYVYNCWSRTEFFEVLGNDNIDTINGVDKKYFKELYDCILEASSDKETALASVCEAIKMSEINNLPDLYYSVST